MPTPVFQLGGSNGWPVKEGKLLGYAEDANGLLRPIPVNFTRNSKSWVTRNGTLVEKAAKVPTIGGTGTGKLVLQPERTNYVDDANNAPIDQGATGLTISEDGTYLGHTVFKIIFPEAVSGVRYVSYLLSSLLVSVTRNLSVYIKASANTDIILGFAISTSRGEVKDISTDWSRIDSNLTSDNDQYLRLTRRDGYTETDPLTIWVALPQVTEGSYLTEPIITDGAALTRLADNVDGTITNEIDSVEGTIVTKITPNALANQSISISDGSFSNAVSIGLRDNGQFRIFTRKSNSNEVLTSEAGSYSANQELIIALRYAVNDFALYVNGVEIVTASSGATYSAGTLTTLKNTRGDAGDAFYGKIDYVKLFPKLTNAEMITETTP